jgi:hypothetical protein
MQANTNTILKCVSARVAGTVAIESVDVVADGVSWGCFLSCRFTE